MYWARVPLARFTITVCLKWAAVLLLMSVYGHLFHMCDI